MLILHKQVPESLIHKILTALRDRGVRAGVISRDGSHDIVLLLEPA